MIVLYRILEWSNTFYDRACVTVTQCTNEDMLNAFYNQNS